jgi:glutathione reductase (NADPH)
MIASGSKSFSPSRFGFQGEEHCIMSDDIFSMEKLPKSMVIIGGGYIGTEMAGIMAAFGVKVTLLVRDILLGRVDPEIVDLLIENMKKHNIDIRMLASTNKVTKNPISSTLNVHLEDGGLIEAEQCLIAIGRVPNIDGMNLSKVGIELEKNGAIKVDEY